MHEPSTARFAIYYVPDPATPLARFACSWLGRDVEDGGAVTPLVVEGLDGARQAAADLIRLWIAEKHANGETIPQTGETLFSTLEVPDDALQSA